MDLKYADEGVFSGLSFSPLLIDKQLTNTFLSEVEIYEITQICHVSITK